VSEDQKPLGAARYSGSDWMKGNKVEMSPFGETVADILGQVYRGIYHLQSPSLFKAKWNHENYIEISLYVRPSTFDGGDLTEMVVLCHDLAVRLEIRPCNISHLKLCFSKRKRDGDFWERHPSIDEAV